MRTTASEWDERYASSDRVWSGQPNGLLVREVDGLEPGAALDVGAGEGADAVWLASRGWSVTAIDISSVAIERAKVASREAEVEVDWIVGDVGTLSGQFDLVAAFYPVVPKDGDMFAKILDLVAPGGTLLFVHHMPNPDSRAHHDAGHHAHHAHGKGPDFTRFMSPADARAALGEGWEIVKDEQVERHVTAGAGARHRLDGLVRAVKL